MKISRLSGFFLVLVCILATVVICGCGPNPKDLKIQNETQRKRIAELESELQASVLEVDQLKRKLQTVQGTSGVELESLKQKIAALEEDIERKKSLIASMQQQLLHGGVSLPVELNTMLEDFAQGNDMITYDSSRGIVKFKSDLLFASGSDQVTSSAVGALKTLCGILNSQEGKKFDVIIAGHTDDERIAKPATLEKHPTNWHLSAHRAISVLNVMTSSDIDPTRVSIRGFGEFRPIVPNKPNKKGNPQNRRVEIYIVYKGM